MITFACLNYYTGRRNVALASVIQTPFDIAAKWQNSLTGEIYH